MLVVFECTVVWQVRLSITSLSANLWTYDTARSHVNGVQDNGRGAVRYPVQERRQVGYYSNRRTSAW